MPAPSSGEPATDNPDVVEGALGDAIDVLIASGRTPGGPPSTIVAASGDELRLVRPGAIAWDEIQAWAGK